MKVTIDSLGLLSYHLGMLTKEQLTQEVKIIECGKQPDGKIDFEITEEPFLVNPNNEDQFGYPSELKKHHRDWEIQKFEVKEPIGTVIIFI